MNLANLGLEKLKVKRNVIGATSNTDSVDDGGEIHVLDACQSDGQSTASEGITVIRTDKLFTTSHGLSTAVAPDLCLVSSKTAERVSSNSNASTKREPRARTDARRHGWHEILSFIEVHSVRSGSGLAKDDGNHDHNVETTDDHVSLNASSQVSLSAPTLFSPGKLLFTV
jgi:hypothetical protein